MTHRILVLGSGYAGSTAARALQRRLRPGEAEVTLVNRSDRFVERVRLHQVAAGQQIHCPPIEGVDLVVAEVTGVDIAGGVAHLGDHDLRFDTLVYALGSGGDLDRVPGAREHALAVGSLEGATRIQRRLDGLREGQSVVVVGGGLTGIETAAELAEARPDLEVALVSTAGVGGWLHPRARAHLRRGLFRLGVAVHEGVSVAAVDADCVWGATGLAVPAELVVWAAGFAVPAMAAEAGLAVDPQGRVAVDDQLRSISHPQVYAIGDVAALSTPSGTARMSCQTGQPMGSYVAAAITRLLRGRPARPVTIRYVWQNISLGRHDGVTQFTRTDDTPRQLLLTGRAAARFKELITRGAAWAALR